MNSSQSDLLSGGDMQRYTGSHKMRRLVADNPLLLPALTRFGISLGFGDRTVADVCVSVGVDCRTFLAVANFISDKPYESSGLDAGTLVNYLKSAHSYFLEYILPDIRSRLISAISTGASGDVALVILKFYDEYVSEVRRHMEYEDSHVFTYVENLLAGRASDGFTIADFKDNHHPIAAKLKEIKDILVCHFETDRARVDMLNALLFDIVICERDLIAHCRVEDKLFVPAILELEKHVAVERKAENTLSDGSLDEHGDVMLTPRERDIVTCIARGMSNKEIADKLFLSVHTVATHRRNICSKLDIHSASGMTMFAILHGLVEIESISK
ncbi:MAG: LuxR C-terminal-related transcriptional regulator [Muribaculaceae bacterium]|nr:LuxR C-terminal-related transcriptional regulator [Muribaculaceae bacterium]